MKDILQYRSYSLKTAIACSVFLLAPSITCLGFFKSIPETPTAKNGYLTLQAPPKLRFHETKPLADRRKLMLLESKPDTSTIVVKDDTASQGSSFPLISYDDQNDTSPVYTIPAEQNTIGLKEDLSLPLNDPFVDGELPEPNLNNTDELMQILESTVGKPSRKPRTNVDFVPPFTLDGGNMIMESKSRYTRRVR